MDLEILAEEAKILFPVFQELKIKKLENTLSEAEFVALYLLVYQFTRTPENSLQGLKKKLNNKDKQPNLKTILTNKNLTITLDYFLDKQPNHFLELSLIEIFELNFKGLPQKMNIAITQWLKGHWPLKLFFHIPSAREILEMQKLGFRCVTVLTSKKTISSHVLEKRDALSFVIHDLEHAVNFYNEEHLKAGQIGFYHFIAELLNTNWMNELVEKNHSVEFHHHLDYVIADMNAYSVHLAKYLYGILSKHSSYLYDHHQLEKNWKEFLTELNLPKNIYETLSEINSPKLSDVRVEELHSWFVARGSQSHQNDEVSPLPPLALS